MACELEGNMLEVCSCEAVCPCFVNEIPDGGTCDVSVASHIKKGTVDVDLSGHNAIECDFHFQG